MTSCMLSRGFSSIWSTMLANSMLMQNLHLYGKSHFIETILSRLNNYFLLLMFTIYLSLHIQGETELSYRLTPSLTRSHTKPRTKQLREEVILVKQDISLKDNSVSYCTYCQIWLLVQWQPRPPPACYSPALQKYLSMCTSYNIEVQIICTHYVSYKRTTMCGLQ